MKHTLKIILILATLTIAACRSSDYIAEVSCANSSDPGCNPASSQIGEPKNLNATPISSSKIKVTWQNPSYEGQFLIALEIRENGTQDFSTVEILNGDQNSFDVESLEPLTQYFFRVKAVASENESDYAAVADATTLEQSVNALFPKPTSTLTHYAVGVIKIANAWSNTAYASWVSSVQYQHKKEDGGEWQTIAMGSYAAMSAMYIDNTPPKGYVLYRMIVTYTDQSVYTTAPSDHIIAALEKPIQFGVTTTEVNGVTKHLISWEYGSIPNEMGGYQILGYLPDLTQVGPNVSIAASQTSYIHLPVPCPNGVQVSYWMRAISNHPMVAPSNVTPTVVKTCP